MTQGINLCWACRHLDRDGSPAEGQIETGVCAAFPQGIPLEIFADGFDHREPFPGDAGIRFAPVSEKRAGEAVALLAAAPPR